MPGIARIAARLELAARARRAVVATVTGRSGQEHELLAAGRAARAVSLDGATYARGERVLLLETPAGRLIVGAAPARAVEILEVRIDG